MYKLFSVVVIAIMVAGCSAEAKAGEAQVVSQEVVFERVRVITQVEAPVEDPIVKLLDAIAVVESNNNPNARGDFRRGVPMAIGAYQLWKIYVDDVNRIYNTDFEYEDRWDAAKSREMVRLYLIHYGKRYTRLTGKPCTLEVLARIHNGGPNGYRKDATKAYWEKVKAQLEK